MTPTPTPTPTPSLSRADGRSVLRVERRLRHAPSHVWRALTEPERLADWFPGAVTIDLRAGGTITFSDDGPPLPGVVTDLDPPRLIAYTWDTDHLRWELSADGEGSLLVLTHTFDDHAGAASIASGWAACLAALEGDPAPDHRVLHERYVAELGLGAPEAVEGGVRIERQLIVPAADAWAVLAGGLRVGDPGPALWPDAGPVTALREPDLLEHGAADGGWVRWELGPGTGHGVRLRLTCAAPAASEAMAAVQALVAATNGTLVR